MIGQTLNSLVMVLFAVPEPRTVRARGNQNVCSLDSSQLCMVGCW